ncbi:MAG: glycosyltransferase family 2 protein [Deltaproteobacteria bacterium]|nr:glycosyltransferase family 2 protein [Deltaproteobacteria bacterium]
MDKGISIIIPAYNGGSIFLDLLEKIKEQDYAGDIQLIVVDSGSVDGTAEFAEKAGAIVKRIDKNTFHHARTRNYALHLAKYDKVVFIVQDAVPFSETWLSGLEKSLAATETAAVYTSQIPHDDASIYARFEVDSINISRGPDPKLCSLDSLEAFHKMPYEKACRTIGLDNVCAIYRKELLEKTPFPDVEYAEDMAWALKIMLSGYSIFYQPNIKVKHSHNRPPEYGFQRQVVNSVWPAKIMGRVKVDHSFLSIKDITVLSLGVLFFAEDFKSRFFTEEAAGKKIKILSEETQKIPKPECLTESVMSLLTPSGEKSISLDVELQKAGVERQACQEITDSFDLIRNKYNVILKDSLIDVIDQLVAKVLGRIYGEVFASYILKDDISPELDDFMRPYLHGI